MVEGIYSSEEGSGATPYPMQLAVGDGRAGHDSDLRSWGGGEITSCRGITIRWAHNYQGNQQRHTCSLPLC